MKIGAIAPWFGSKRTLAPRIVAELGKHRAYFEPFCGSMAVLLAKPACRQETVNDLHGDLINLARVIQDGTSGPLLYRRLRRTLMHEDELARARATLLAGEWSGEAPELDRAWAFFVASWTGRNGTVGTKSHVRTTNFCVRWTANGGDSATRFRGAVESIAAWRRRLRNVTILRRDAFDILTKLPDEAGLALYVDPPYLEKKAVYEHDFGSAFMGSDDHDQLAGLLRRFTQSRVVISYYDHPRLKALYPGWVRLDCSMTKNLSVSSRRGGESQTAPEVLLLNGPQLAKEVA